MMIHPHNRDQTDIFMIVNRIKIAITVKPVSVTTTWVSSYKGNILNLIYTLIRSSKFEKLHVREIAVF